MLVVVDGVVHNSETDKISLMLFANERADLKKALAAGKDIFNSFPSFTKPDDLLDNVKVLKKAKDDLIA